MKTTIHEKPDGKVAEIYSDGVQFSTVQNILDLMANLDYDIRKIIIYEENINPQFFNLKTGLAGDILQKFVNYKMQLAIVGDFSKYPGKSLQDFIRESNQGRQIFFVDSIETALIRLTGARTG